MNVVRAVLLLFVLNATSGESTEKSVVPIVKFGIEGPNPENGAYVWNYETGNGITAEEQGELKNAGNEETEAMEVRGSYQYTAPDGSVIEVNYIANENGFQPTGSHIVSAGGKSNQAQASNVSAKKQRPPPKKATEKPKSNNGLQNIDSVAASFFKPVFRTTRKQATIKTHYPKKH